MWKVSTVFLIEYPILSNIFLAVVSFFIKFDTFTKHHWICYLAVVGATATVTISFMGFIINDFGPAKTLLAMVIQAAALIFIFGGIYRGYGLIYNGSHVSLSHDGASALYFSIVTWTTLGYGDFSPPAAIRLITAIQAILGYVMFGVSVGLGTFLICEGRGLTSTVGRRR